jgi:CheY-like chemotaxis protein
MSHEIRTPMNAILGITEIQLQNELLPPELKESFLKINHSGDLLLHIINDILDLSKIDAGKLKLEPSKYNVATLINDIVHLNIIRHDTKPLDFKLFIDQNIPAELFGDEFRLKQILNNLLSNAFKYTSQGEITLSVTAEFNNEKEDPGVMLIFRVSDTGQGMTAEQIDKLFDEYTRFNFEANRTTEGTGLGMNITRHLVRIMNGKIFVESEPGKGSVFTVHLPQGSTGAGPLGGEVAESLQQLHLIGGSFMKKAQIVREYMPYGKVLIVDDVETNIYVSKGLLAPYGLLIDAVDSGFKAIDKIKAGNTYDVIFMDHLMPKMDGMEATKVIRGLGYMRSIIALTANAVSGQEEMFLANGFDGFLSKPIDIRQLNVMLNRLVRDKYPPEVVETARRQRDNFEKYSAGRIQQPSEDEKLAGIFAGDAEKAVITLEEISKNNYRRNDDVQVYITTVHAVKSALANIGETELSDMALKLEQAGREQNVDAMIAGTPEFLRALQAVIGRIMSNDGGGGSETPDQDSDDARVLLHEKLLAIQTACAEYNKKAAKEVLAELRQKTWSRQTGTLLDAIAGHLLHGDFEKAADAAGDSIN